jgi:hypothetical protein
MQDSVPYLLARLEQGEASEEDIASIKVLLELKCDRGLMTTELYFTMVQYVEQLEENQQ